MIDRQHSTADYVFPAGPEKMGYSGLAGLWSTTQHAASRLAAAEAAGRGASKPTAGPLDGITLHSLLHSFAGVAESLGATIPTIAALLGHRLGGVTGGYILKRVDVLLIDAADRTAEHIAQLMRGDAPPSTIVHFRPRGRPPIS